MISLLHFPPGLAPTGTAAAGARPRVPLAATALAMLGLLAMAAWAPSARAATVTCTATGGPLSIPTVTVTADTPIGPITGAASGPVTVTFACSFDGRDPPSSAEIWANLGMWGLAAADDGSSAGIIFASSLPGIGVRLTATPNPAQSSSGGTSGFAAGEIAAGEWVTDPSTCNGNIDTQGGGQCKGVYLDPSDPVTETFTAQLYKTGTVTAGTTGTVTLLNFSTDGGTAGSLLLAPFTVKVSTCSIATDPTVVTLDPVLATQFSGAGSTAAQKSFAVELTGCSGGLSLSIELDTADPAGPAGVINSSGSAGGVGVQLLKANGSTPVAFGSTILVGTTTAGDNAIPFYARYYQTGPSVTGGTVSATATYTLTYE
ncbi:MAG TPA: fimbrial protein [Rhodanobacteraceae bacterium]|nr:fimbrial protein [Rhodanobacteraceae bacterium]